MGIGYASTLYFVCGLLLAKGFDILYGKFNIDDYKHKQYWIVILEIIFHLFLIGIVAYLLRNIIERIPFVLDGVGGFKYGLLKELQGGQILGILIIIFQKNLIEKIQYIYNIV